MPDARLAFATGLSAAVTLTAIWFAVGVVLLLLRRRFAVHWLVLYLVIAVAVTVWLLFEYARSGLR